MAAIPSCSTPTSSITRPGSSSSEEYHTPPSSPRSIQAPQRPLRPRRTPSDSLARYDGIIDLNFAPAYLGRAKALMALQRYEEALEFIQKYHEMRPNDPSIYEHLVEIYVSLNQLYEARTAPHRQFLDWSFIPDNTTRSEEAETL